MNVPAEQLYKFTTAAHSEMMVLVAVQFPKRALEKISISLRTDPFNMRMVARIRTPNGVEWDFDLDDKGKLSERDIATVCATT